MLVDDSLMMRAMLKNMIENDPQKRFAVVASAEDGIDALIKLKTVNVDVILMDVEMPKKNGLETLKEIMTTKPKAVVMFSSLTRQGARETIESLSLGAVDFMSKPTIGVDIKVIKEELLEKLFHASMVKVEHKIRNIPNIKPSSNPAPSSTKLTNLIAIGCSTGGPKALKEILPQIHEKTKAALLIVQHMPPGGYTSALAEYLDQSCALKVREAAEGMEVTDGFVYIAPGGFHMEIIKKNGKYEISLNKKEPIASLRPSVDELYRSIVKSDLDVPVFATILTGMGSDGTLGVQELREKRKQKTMIIAESRNTAIIFGMPRQVIERGYADYVLDLDQIIPFISAKL